MRQALRRELLDLVAHDDATRDRLAADGSLFRGYHPEMEAVHRRNAARLRAVMVEHGWPGRSLVGDDGAAAAWRIVQHAIGEPALLRACLPVLLEAVARGEAEPAHAAFLDDRIRMFEGRPQRYGTQYDWDDDGRWMVPVGGIEDEEGVDERRAAVGLGRLERRRPPPPGEPPPADREERRREMEAWAERVGWRPPRASVV